jgi:type II secretory pathway pseudopilin PulG
MVELVIVITILSILGVISFMGVQWYTRDARDSARLTDISVIDQWLSIAFIKTWRVPIPENKIDITSSWELIWYQGDVWKKVLSDIDIITKKVKDPLDDTYYSYIVDDSFSNYQILSYLEGPWYSWHPLVDSTYAEDDKKRFKKLKWDNLWILTEPSNDILIHKLSSVILSWSLDVGTTSDMYTANFDDGIAVSWTGSDLKMLSSVFAAGWVIRDDCKTLLADNPSLKNRDGIYTINLEAPFEVYCDMTTDQGGWTLFWINGNIAPVTPVEFFTGTWEIWTSIESYSDKTTWSIGIDHFQLSNFELATTVQTSTQSQLWKVQSSYDRDLTNGVIQIPTYEYLLEDNITLWARWSLGIRHKCGFDTSWERTLNYIDSIWPMQFTDTIDGTVNNDIWNWNTSGYISFSPDSNYCESWDPIYTPWTANQTIVWIR